MIPIINNRQKQSPFWQMNETNLRVLLDAYLRNIQFVRIIRGQGEVAELLS